jgi:hypothetical protein
MDLVGKWLSELVGNNLSERIALRQGLVFHDQAY